MGVPICILPVKIGITISEIKKIQKSNNKIIPSNIQYEI